jgi:hypothetical protein
MKTIWFIVRGIAGSPSNFVEWEYLVRDHIIRKLGVPAVAVSYATSFATVWRNRSMRANRFAEIIKAYADAGWTMNFIAHSEGTVVALDALRSLYWPKVGNLHLVCGACDNDFERLGMNYAIRQDMFDSVHVWIAGQDSAMHFENLAIGRMLFQVKMPLGLKGPVNIDPIARSMVRIHYEMPWFNYGHSDCWLPENMAATVDGILLA